MSSRLLSRPPPAPPKDKGPDCFGTEYHWDSGDYNETSLGAGPRDSKKDSTDKDKQDGDESKDYPKKEILPNPSTFANKWRPRSFTVSWSDRGRPQLACRSGCRSERGRSPTAVDTGPTSGGSGALPAAPTPTRLTGIDIEHDDWRREYVQWSLEYEGELSHPNIRLPPTRDLEVDPALGYMLTNNWRQHSTSGKFFNKQFYGNKLHFHQIRYRFSQVDKTAAN